MSLRCARFAISYQDYRAPRLPDDVGCRRRCHAARVAGRLASLALILDDDDDEDDDDDDDDDDAIVSLLALLLLKGSLAPGPWSLDSLFSSLSSASRL